MKLISWKFYFTFSFRVSNSETLLLLVILELVTLKFYHFDLFKLGTRKFYFDLFFRVSNSKFFLPMYLESVILKFFNFPGSNSEILFSLKISSYQL